MRTRVALHVEPAPWRQRVGVGTPDAEGPQGAALVGSGRGQHGQQGHPGPLLPRPPAPGRALCCLQAEARAPLSAWSRASLGYEK